MKNIVLVLGAGRSQIPIMQLCKKYGKQVLTVSPEGPYPGFDYADYSEVCDVRDEEKVLEIAKKYDICAVLSEQLDEAVPTAAFVSEHIGVKGIPYAVAEKFRDKSLMLENAKAAGINVPLSITASNLEDARNSILVEGLQYPLIIKPVDSSASRGVYMLNNEQDLFTHFESSIEWSKTKRTIIEEFIEGTYYYVDAYTHNYKTTNIDVGQYHLFDLPGLFITKDVCSIDAISGSVNSIDQEVMSANKKLIEYYGLPFGITHGEFIYSNKDQKVYLVEIAARGGGGFIASDIVPKATGVNMTDLYVRDVLGLEMEETIEIGKGAAGSVFYLLPEGIIESITGVDNISSLKGVFKCFFDNIEVGLVCSEIQNKASRRGPILVCGGDRTECYAVMEQVKKKLDVTVVKNGMKRNIIW